MRILTASQMKQAEAEAVAAGSSYEILMENAGTAATRQLLQLATENDCDKSVLFLCGKGNNAGDAFVMARLLAPMGWQCRLLMLYNEGLSPLATLNLQRLPAEVQQLMPGQSAELSNALAATVIVDGIFGTGFHGQLPPFVAEVCALANARPQALRIALDVPSGLNCDTGDAAENTFRAHHTFTFGAYKPGLLAHTADAFTGRLHVLDIGL